MMGVTRVTVENSSSSNSITTSSRRDCLKIGLPRMDSHYESHSSSSCGVGLPLQVPHDTLTNPAVPRKPVGVRYSDLIGAIMSTGALLNRNNANSNGNGCQSRHQPSCGPAQRRQPRRLFRQHSTDDAETVVESDSEDEDEEEDLEEEEDLLIEDNDDSRRTGHHFELQLQEERLYLQAKPAFGQLCFPEEQDQDTPEDKLSLEESPTTVATHLFQETAEPSCKNGSIEPSSSVCALVLELPTELVTHREIRDMEAAVDRHFEDIMMNLSDDDDEGDNVSVLDAEETPYQQSSTHKLAMAIMEHQDFQLQQKVNALRAQTQATTRMDQMLSCDFVDQPVDCSTITWDNSIGNGIGDDIDNDLHLDMDMGDLLDQAMEDNLAFLQEMVYD